LQERAHFIELFSAEVLRPLDRAAYAAVARAARDAGAVTAVAPTALLDTVLLLWRNLRMIREVAAIYGHRTGLAGTWFLVKRLATGAAVVAAADIAGSVIVQQLGNAVADMLAARVGEGAIAGARTARIGLWTMQLCRAVPFADEDVPTLRKLAASLIR
jgi:putative membrane protein